MSNPTVNISDFRCRAAVRGSVHANRSQLRKQASGMFVVKAETASVEQEIETSVCAQGANEVAVIDIAAARDSHRLAHRSAVRPLTFHRRAKVLHFTKDVQVRKAMMAESQRFQTWPARAESPMDLPPAA